MRLEHSVVAPLLRGALLERYRRPFVVMRDDGRAGEGLVIRLGDKRDSGRDGGEIARAISAGDTPEVVTVCAGGERITLRFGAAVDTVRAKAESGGVSLWESDDAAAPDSLTALGRAGVVRGRIALVTGGAQGFGAEIARGLAASGALVFIADMNLPGAKTLAGEINAGTGRVSAIAAEVNVADEESVERLFRGIAESAGGLDICVSNAGVLRAGSVLEQAAVDFRFVTEVNYTGFFLVAKHAARLMRLQNGMAPEWMTDIIQINSKSGLEGSNRNAAYAGGKFGGVGLTQSFALELVEYGIKVNAVCPGNFFDGPLWSDPERGLFVQYLRAGKVPGARTVADVKSFYESKVPMGRGCGGADVMRAIFYLVEQRYETGQALPVTGGQVMLH